MRSPIGIRSRHVSAGGGALAVHATASIQHSSDDIVLSTTDFSTTPSSSDLLVVFLWGRFDPKTGGFGFDPAGWTSRFSVSGGSGSGEGMKVFTRSASGFSTSTFQVASVIKGVLINAYAISNPVTGYDGGNIFGDVTNTSPCVVPAASPAGTVDFLIGCFAASATSLTPVITLPVAESASVLTNSYHQAPAWSVLKSGVETLAASGTTGTRSATNVGGTSPHGSFGAIICVK